MTTQQRWLVSMLLLVGCGGGAGTQTTAPPAGSASGVVRSFMQAVADSNLSKMANLWGTAAGPAAKTNVPPDYPRRIAVMQAYLRNRSFKVISDQPQGSENRRAVQVELKRETCTWKVPFVAIKTTDGTWLVTQVDLAAAGNPARPCVDPATADTSQG